MLSALARFTLAATACTAACSADGPTVPDGFSASGVWRSDEFLRSGQYSARLRITIDAEDPADLRGSWAWGFDYGGGVTGGSVSEGQVRVEMTDYDTWGEAFFSGTADGSGNVINGTVSGVVAAAGPVAMVRDDP